MILKFVLDILRHDEFTFMEKIKTMLEFMKYYNNLHKNLASGAIYHKPLEQNKDYKNFVNTLTQNDFKLLEVLFKDNIVDFLSKIELKNHLEFDKKIGITQIGYNTIYVHKPHIGLWTTGKATFYLPTKQHSINKIIIELFSVPPINVTIGFENEEIKKINMKKLTTKTIEIILDPSKITKSVSEIYINTDRLWLPGTVLGVEESITIGIGVKSIRLLYS